VQSGEAKALVVATGQSTEFGKLCSATTILTG
jgi:magnesium-transporting ATPase (P-type)